MSKFAKHADNEHDTPFKVIAGKIRIMERLKRKKEGSGHDS